MEKALARPAREVLRRPPRLSGGLPLIGHTLEFVRDTVGLLFRAHRECGEVAAFRVAHRRMVLLTGPRASEAFFTAPEDVLRQKEVYRIMVPVFGKDVAYDASPERMVEQLGFLMPAIRHQRLVGYGEVIAREVRRAVRDWGDRGELDFLDFARVLTNFTSTSCLLGREFREEMTEEFARVYHDLEQGVTPLAYVSPYLPLPSFRKRDLARERLVKMISAIVARRRGREHEAHDFLQTLMEARYKDGSALTDHELTGLLLAAMFAGHHTSSVSTTWTMLELLQRPDYLERVRRQIEEVFDGKPRDEVSFQSIREATLLDHAIRETLRLHPPLFMLLRYALKDFDFDGYRIRRGTFLIASPLVSHRLPSVFPDPDRFDPDRFGPERAEDQRPFAYITFGGGRHKCVGNPFALLQIKIIFAILLRSYQFELAGDPILPDFRGLVAGPRQPCRVRYRRLGSG